MVQTVGTPVLWSAFAVVVVVALAADLFLFHHRAHEVRFREAATWVLVWIALAVAFGLAIGWMRGGRPALEFFTGYVVEYALSIDNIFVFIVVFRYFGTPPEHRHDVLFWGVLGAIVLRGVFIVAGVALIGRFEWVLYLFGAFLVYTGIKLLGQSEVEVDPERNPLLQLLQRHLRVSPALDGGHFTTRIDGRLFATPLLVVLIAIEATDVVFAVDSIPAIFGVTRDPFIVFTSNIFAVLGLRALYFVLHDLMTRFAYLHIGLGLVLAFIGAKMVASHWIELPVQWSLAVVVLLLAGATIASVLFPPREDADDADRTGSRRDPS